METSQSALEKILLECQKESISLPVLGNRFFNKLLEDEVEVAVKNEVNNKGVGRLTERLAQINADLWNEAKMLGGTSKGTSWTAERIILIAFLKFIELVNGVEFESVKLISKGEKSHDLNKFVLEKNCKKISIYRAASLQTIMNDKDIPRATDQLFNGGTAPNKAPDIMVLKEENGIFKIVAILEIKVYLDKPAIQSGTAIIKEIADSQLPNCTEYGLFTFSAGPKGKNNRGADTRNLLKDFEDQQKNSLMLNRYYLEMLYADRPKEVRSSKGEQSMDLSDFFNKIKKEISI